jgi:WD40 repeat protein
MRTLPGKTWLAVWPIVILAFGAPAPGQEVRLRRILRGPQSPVYCVAVSPDGKSVAGGTRGGHVVCWDVDTGRPEWSRHAHEDCGTGFTQVLSIAFSPDGKTLASGGWDRAVRLWGASSGAPRRTLPHGNLVYAVAFSPDGKTLASGVHQPGAIHLWEVATGQSAGVLATGGRVGRSVWSLAFAPDGKSLACGAGGVVQLWEVSRRVPTLEVPTPSAWHIAFSPDGRLVAGTGQRVRANGPEVDGLVRLWDARAGELRHTWTVVGDGRCGTGPVAFSPDGRLIAVGDEAGERQKGRKNGRVHLLDVESGRSVWSQSCHDDDVTGLAFTPDGRTLVSGSRDQTIKLWEIGIK